VAVFYWEGTRGRKRKGREIGRKDIGEEREGERRWRGIWPI